MNEMPIDIFRNLIERIAKDDSKAFAMFYDLYYSKVYRFSSYFVKSDELREEIVSDVFCSIWQSRRKLPETENIDAYLYISIKNRALYYLKQSLKTDHLEIDDLPIAFVSHQETPESNLIAEELRLALKKAVADLPAKCKLIFLMAKEEGLKYKDIARILEISEKTVNAQMVTALKKIGTALKKFLTILL